MEIYLIRHTSLNIDSGICYGQSDVSVSKTFQEESDRVLEKVKNIDFDAYYSSPLSRCRKLAERINKDEISYDKRLMEMNFGDWEMKDWDDINHQDYYHIWANDYENLPCPNGESYREVSFRIKEFMEDIKKKNHERVCIIAHGGVMKTLLVLYSKDSLQEVLDKEVNYGDVVVIEG